ncbi:MAG: hypothetical protein M0C28_38700 [Candidatus Moduliflexus flocculans]|nr:hypothetical protein [Candidatus Moduliflexus flocculans]
MTVSGRPDLERPGALPGHRLLPRARRLLRGHDRPRVRRRPPAASTASRPPRSADRAARALDVVDLTKDKDRLIRGYSRGMRQRIKFAQAVAHDPRDRHPGRAAERARPARQAQAHPAHQGLQERGPDHPRLEPRPARDRGLDLTRRPRPPGQDPGPGRHPLHPRAHRGPPAPDLGPLERPAGAWPRGSSATGPSRR